MKNKLFPALLALTLMACNLSNLVTPAAAPGQQERNLVPLLASPGIQETCAQVTANQALNIRQWGSETAPIIGWLYAAQVIPIIDDSAHWWKVAGGYVNSNYAKVIPCPKHTTR